MADQLSPGTKTTRTKGSAPTIPGVATGTGGFIGTAVQGPINKPQLISSMQQFIQVFGGPLLGSKLYGSVDGFFKNGGARCYVNRVAHYTDITDKTTLTALAAAADLKGSDNSTVAHLTLVNQGGASNGLVVGVSNENTVVTKTTAILAIGAVTSAVLADVSRISVGDLLKIDDGTHTPLVVTVTGISGSTVTFASVTIASGNAITVGARVSNLTFTLWLQDGSGNVVPGSTFDSLRYSPLSVQNYFGTRLTTDTSPYLVAGITSALADARPTSTGAVLASGADGGTVVDTDIVGNAGSLTGLYAFNKIKDGSLLSSPGWNSATVQEAGSEYCDSREDMYWVAAPPAGLNPAGANTYKTVTALLASEQSGFFWPQIKIVDPLTGQPTVFPPEGFIQGAFARTDSSRGVGKVAAGDIDGRLNGAIGVEYEIEDGEYDTIYPNGVNAIRIVEGVGICIYGARNTYLQGDYPKINQSRTVTSIQKALKQGSGWVNFENNDSSTRGRIVRSFTSFLRGQRIAKNLQGSKDSEAFYVICDATNNPPSQQAAGKLKCKVGLAVNNPAEFFEIEIEHDTRALDAELAQGN